MAFLLADLPDLPGLSLSNLPDGWEEVKTGDGQVYYWNRSSNETSWEKPTSGGSPMGFPSFQGGGGLPPPVSSSLPPSIAPVDLPAPSSLPPAVSSAPSLPGIPTLVDIPMLPVVPIVAAQASSQPSPDELPPDWQAVRDDGGNTYYWNSATNETTWTKPVMNASSISTTLLIGPIGASTLPEDKEESVDQNIEETLKMFQQDSEERERAAAQRRRNELARKGVSEKEFQRMEKKRIEEDLKKQKKEKEIMAKEMAKTTKGTDKEVAVKVGNFDLDTAKRRLEEQQKAAEEKIRRIRDEEKQVAEAQRIAEEQRARDERLKREREEAERLENERRLAELKKQREEEEERRRREEEERIREETRLALLAEEQRKKEQEELRIKHEAEEKTRRAEEEKRRLDEEIKRAQFEEQKKRRDEEERKRKLIDEQRLKMEAERIAGLEMARKAEEERLKKLADAQTNALMSDLGLEDDEGGSFSSDIVCEVFRDSAVPSKRLGPISVPSDMKISLVKAKIRDIFGEFNMRVGNNVVFSSRDNDMAATVLKQADAIAAPAPVAPVQNASLSLGDLDELLGLASQRPTNTYVSTPSNYTSLPPAKPVQPAPAPVQRAPPPQPSMLPAAQAAVTAAAAQPQSGTLTLTPAAQDLAKQIEPGVRNQILTTVQNMTPAAKKQLVQQLKGQETHARQSGKALPLAHQLYMLLLTEVAPNVPLALQNQIKDAVEKMPPSQRSLLLTQLRAKPTKTPAESFYVECIEKKIAGVGLDSVDDLSLDDVDVLEPGGKQPIMAPVAQPLPQPGDGVPPQLLKQIKDTVAGLPLARRQQLLADLNRKKATGPVTAAEDFYIHTLKQSLQSVGPVIAPTGLNSANSIAAQNKVSIPSPNLVPPNLNLPPQLRMQIENAVSTMMPPQGMQLMQNLLAKKNSSPLTDAENYYLMLLWKRFGNAR